jgi:hypothetical protein
LLQEITQGAPRNVDTFTAMIDVELWSGEFEAALEYVVLAILLALQLSVLLYKKAIVEQALCRTEEALASISDFLALSPGE